MLTRTLPRLAPALLAVALVLAALGLPASAPVYAAPLLLIVDRTDDVAAASACTGPSSDCSLRGAITTANANPGSTIVLDHQTTYQLTNNVLNTPILTASTTLSTSLGACSSECSAVIAGSGFNYRLLNI